MKGRRVRLTDAGVGKLKPDTTEYAVWDSEVPGLGVRVRPSGHRSFVWHGRVEGKKVRATVGPAALMTVEDARKETLALRVGTTPRTAEGRSGVPLFRDFVLDEWLPAYRRRCAPSSFRSANRVLERQLIPAFGRFPLDAIRRIGVERWFDAYSRTAPGGANKALEILGQIMNAALAAGHVETAPVKGIAKNPRPKLTRFLSAEEIETLLCVLDRLVEERPSRRRQADVIRLLLLAGCRVGEILKLQWSEVDGDYRPPEPRTETAVPNLPLTRAATPNAYAMLLVALSACKVVTLEEASVTQPTYGTEAEDWGVPATDELRQDAFHAPTPTTHPTAAVINTQDLHAQLIGPNPPVTINAVSGKNQVTSIPGSIWLPAAGQGGTFDDNIQTYLASTIQTITDNDLARPIVVYCLDANCWLSYNAALRLHALGYENLYWYRGGIASWKAANLPTRMASAYRQ